MDKRIRDELLVIADYVKYHTNFDVRSKNRTRKIPQQAALYLFYVLSEEYTDATHEQISKVSGRKRASVTAALLKNSDYAKAYYPHFYKSFNPFALNIRAIDQPFSPTIEVLYRAKEQLEKDIAFMKNEEKDTLNYMLRQVKNEKVFNILKMVKDLNKHQLDIILERLPPIIKMARKSK